MSARLLYFLVIAILFSINTSAQNKSRITPDLTLFELRGPVKSVSKGFLMDGVDNSGCIFNSNGKIIKINRPEWINYSGIKFSRDYNGFINQISGVPTGDEGIHKITYNISYDYNCKVQRIDYYYEAERQTITDIKYKNHLIIGYTAVEEYTYAEELPAYIEYSFNYTKFDKYGNWTSRTVKTTRYQNRFLYEHKKPESSETNVQSRTITYYK